MHVLPSARGAVLGFVVNFVAQIKKSGETAVRLQTDVSAIPAIAPVWSTFGNEFLEAEGEASMNFIKTFCASDSAVNT